MGRRQRKRRRGGEVETSATNYRDPEGNELVLRDSLSASTVEKVRALETAPAASADDLWQRRSELLFERLAVRWAIAGLPLTAQKELLGRYRMATAGEREWVRRTIDEHVQTHVPEL